MTLFHVGLTPGKLTLNSSSTEKETSNDVPLVVVYLIWLAILPGMACFIGIRSALKLCGASRSNTP